MNNNSVIESLQKYSFFKKIPYSTCWEDFHIIKKALKIKKGDIVLSITSGGCNTLNAILQKPSKIYSIDFNQNQNHLLQLKITGIKNLNYKKFLKLIGIMQSKQREKIYEKIRDKLPKETKNFWDKNIKLIKKGITYNGRQERYIHFLGQYLRYLKGEDILIDFLKTKNQTDQIKYFNKNIKDYAWKLFFDLVYNKPVMLIAKDKLVFNQIKENSYHIKFRTRVEDAIIRVPARGNPFMSFALLGYYLDKNYYPDYLKKKNYELLKKNIDKVIIKTSSIKNFLKDMQDNSIDKFNLSNVLDWTEIKEFKNILKEIRRVGTNNSRFCYLNTLMQRRIPKIKGIKSYKKMGTKLLKNDRSFLYENFEIGEIKKK